jgi:alkylation response protein AidB-like acyl-CoA dehydrogenase
MDFNLTDEQRMWRESVRDFCEREVKPRARHVDETGEFNWEAAHKMGPLGLLGLSAPEEFGGAGVDAISAAIAIEELGRALAVARWRFSGRQPRRTSGYARWRAGRGGWPRWPSPNPARVQTWRAA